MTAPKRSRRTARVGKQPFAIETAMPLLRAAVAPYPKAALFELAADGFGSVFELLVACVISIRTRDEVSLPVARRLFAAARTPAEVVALNALLVPFGKHLCTLSAPSCSTCPLLSMCRQLGVTKHR